MANAEEQELMAMTREHETRLADLEARIAALEDLADNKEGAPKKTAAKKG